MLSASFDGFWGLRKGKGLLDGRRGEEAATAMQTLEDQEGLGRQRVAGRGHSEWKGWNA